MRQQNATAKTVVKKSSEITLEQIVSKLSQRNQFLSVCLRSFMETVALLPRNETPTIHCDLYRDLAKKIDAAKTLYRYDMEEMQDKLFTVL